MLGADPLARCPCSTSCSSRSAAVLGPLARLGELLRAAPLGARARSVQVRSLDELAQSSSASCSAPLGLLGALGSVRLSSDTRWPRCPLPDPPRSPRPVAPAAARVPHTPPQGLERGTMPLGQGSASSSGSARPPRPPARRSAASASCSVILGPTRAIRSGCARYSCAAPPGAHVRHSRTPVIRPPQWRTGHPVTGPHGTRSGTPSDPHAPNPPTPATAQSPANRTATQPGTTSPGRYRTCHSGPHGPSTAPRCQMPSRNRAVSEQ